MPSHVKWTEIESFHNVRRALSKYPHLAGRSTKVTYKAKAKLHGTNAGVRVDPDGTITAFSRTSVITPESDNAGFAGWLAGRTTAFDDAWRTDLPTVVYGEWCGPGIQKGVAVNQLIHRVFAVFGARYLDPVAADATLDFIYEPRELVSRAGFTGFHVIPWFNDGELFTIDWSAPVEELQPVLDRINAHVLAVEACDPWVKATFGIEGTGEGLVFYPVDDDHQGYEGFKNLCFKAKGDKHQVVAHTKPAQADPTVVAGLSAFAELVVTPARLEQAVRAVNGGELVFDQKNIGAFLAWLNRDIAKETAAELEASGLDQKAAIKACNSRATSWYVAEMKRT